MGERGGKMLTNTSLQIEDTDTAEWTQVLGAFSEHFRTINTDYFLFKKKQKLIPSISELSCNEEKLFCGFSNKLKHVDINDFIGSIKAESESHECRKHPGLTAIKCSKTSPNIFYTSSTDGTILQWDLREKSYEHSQKYSLDSNGSVIKPIVSFDLSSNDQIICGGTELVGEDSFLLFWDIRSTKQLGAYWESHSDEITSVKFHDSKPNIFASGSTDGLVNIFNMLETSEDDALLYSFNTESSVEKLHWATSSTLISLTHTNDIHVWDTDSGDKKISFTRSAIAKKNFRSNDEAMYLNGCFKSKNGNPLIISSSLAGSGSGARILELTGDDLAPKSILLDQQCLIQTVQHLSKTSQWLTTDEKGSICIHSTEGGDNTGILDEQSIHFNKALKIGKRAEIKDEKPYSRSRK